MTKCRGYLWIQPHKVLYKYPLKKKKQQQSSKVVKIVKIVFRNYLLQDRKIHPSIKLASIPNITKKINSSSQEAGWGVSGEKITKRKY